MLLALLVHRYRLIDHADYRLHDQGDADPQARRLHPHPGPAHARRPRRGPRRAGRAPRRRRAHRGRRGRPTSGAARPASARAPALLLLHGSNYGTCRDFAERLADEAAGLGFADRGRAAGRLRRRAARRPARSSSSPPPTTAGPPTTPPPSPPGWTTAPDGAADGLPYAVLGVGDRNWAATYQHVPTLHRRPARRHSARTGCCDARRGRRLRRPQRHRHASSPRALRTALLERYGDPDDHRRGAGRRRRHDRLHRHRGHRRPAGRPRRPPRPRPDDRHRGPRPHRPGLRRGPSASCGSPCRTASPTAPPTTSPCCRPTPRPSSSGPPHALGADPDTVLATSAPAARAATRLPVDRPLTVRQLLTHHVELQAAPDRRAAGACSPPPTPARPSARAAGRPRRGRPAHPDRPDRGPPGAARAP